MIPVLLGIIGHYVALQWEPKPTGEELYDDFGNRIVEYPKMPIAYLQQTRKDMSATRLNRNSLAWLCHKWLISTNDVVQELQASYPLEQSTLRTVPEKTGRGKIIASMHEKLQKAALEWRIQQKKLKKDDLRKKLDMRKRARPLHTLPAKLVFRKASASDVEYLRRRVMKAKRLWIKLNSWVEEFEKRSEQTRHHPSDSNDSYWSSSETFSSDSGEHWKSYKGDAHRWANEKRTTTQWKLEKARRMHDAWTAAEDARKKKEDAAAAAAAALAEAKSKESDKRRSSSGKFFTIDKTKSEAGSSSKKDSNKKKKSPK